MAPFDDLDRLLGRRRRAVTLNVDGSRVRCPRFGEIDLDRCLRCPRLMAYDGRQLTCRDDRPWWQRLFS